MVALRLYVEGGGDAKSLHIACRKGFAQFLEKAGLRGHMPRIIASGGRQQAYHDFRTAHQQSPGDAMLLVDSEAPVTSISPWDHLAQRPGDVWKKPGGAADEQCHLMVQCMEAWLVADRSVLAAYFGQGFAPAALPAETRLIETIDKATLNRALIKATAKCKTKLPYAKGEHSFELLSQIDPSKVTRASPWADRFVNAVKSKMRV